MRGLSLVGLLVGLGVVGVLMFNQLKPSPEAEMALPTQAIEKANEAAEIMEQQQTGAAEAIEQQAEQLQQDMQKMP
jgi:Tfp pilus assembly protein PilN